MTRIEQIREAAENYTEIQCGLKLKLDEDWEDWDVDDITNAFKAGAEFAYEHTKSHWISVQDDLPCNHEEYIGPSDKDSTIYVIALVTGFAMLSGMEKFEGKWHWITVEPTYWMPIPKLPEV